MKTLFQFPNTPIFGVNQSGVCKRVSASSRSQRLFIWAATASLLLTGSANAQEYALAKTDSKATANNTAHTDTKGYWKLTTQAGADSTKVEFYKPDSQLISETMLPNKQVTLTKKNIRTLNEILDRLTTDPSAALSAKQFNPDGTEIPTNELQIGAYASRDGIHLHLLIDNPRRERAAIQIWNGYRKVYEEFTYTHQQHYKFDMSQMPTGNYELRVVSKRQSLQRAVAFNRPQAAPTMTVALPQAQIAIK